MTSFGQSALLIYSILVLIGGIIGYTSAKSMMSLMAGAGSAVLLGIAYVLSRTQPKAGLGMGAVLATLLVVVFWRGYQARGQFMPTGMLAIVSVIAVLIFAAAAFGTKR